MVRCLSGVLVNTEIRYGSVFRVLPMGLETKWMEIEHGRRAEFAPGVPGTYAGLPHCPLWSITVITRRQVLIIVYSPVVFCFLQQKGG